MAQSVQTTAIAWGSAVESAASMTTRAPLAYELGYGIPGLELRQEVPTVTCGYYSWTDQVWPWACESATSCRTIASHFGCLGTVYTTCYASTATECATDAVLDQRELCCTYDVTYPACVTGIKTEDNGDELTAYNCGKDVIQGELSIYNTSPNFDTTATTESESDSLTAETVDSSTFTTVPSSRSTTNPSDLPAETSSDPNKDDDGGSSTPIGAIVGGVVGGVALIALVVLAVFLVKRRDKKKAAAAAAAGGGPPGGPDSEVASPHQQQQMMQHQQQFSPGVGVPPSPATYPPVYQSSLASPAPDHQRESYQDGFVPAGGYSQPQSPPAKADGFYAPPAPVPSPQGLQQQQQQQHGQHGQEERVELPSERHRDTAPVELQ